MEKNLKKAELETIGMRLKEAQRIAGYCDREMAELLEVGVQAYRSMIHGRMQITESKFIILCNHLHISMDYLFHGITRNGIFVEDDPDKAVLPHRYKTIDEMFSHIRKLPKNERNKMGTEILFGFNRLFLDIIENVD